MMLMSLKLLLYVIDVFKTSFVRYRCISGILLKLLQETSINTFVFLIFIEAAGERLMYARAVSDYNNKFDDTCLTFKAGDNIAVSSRN